MSPEEYIKEGVRLHKLGKPTDGCSVVGWFVHKIWPELEKACWAHDYGREGLIQYKDQGGNDSNFHEALKHLGAPYLLRRFMYLGVRFQSYFGLSFDAAVTIGALLLVGGIVAYFS